MIFKRSLLAFVLAYSSLTQAELVCHNPVDGGEDIFIFNNNQVTLSTPTAQTVFSATGNQSNTLYNTTYVLAGKNGEQGKLQIHSRRIFSRANTDIGFHTDVKISVDGGQEYFFFNCHDTLF